MTNISTTLSVQYNIQIHTKYYRINVSLSLLDNMWRYTLWFSSSILLVVYTIESIHLTLTSFTFTQSYHNYNIQYHLLQTLTTTKCYITLYKILLSPSSPSINIFIHQITSTYNYYFTAPPRIHLSTEQSYNDRKNTSLGYIIEIKQ